MNKAFLLLAAIASSSLTLSATQILVGSETSLQSILNSNISGGSVNVNTDQVADDAYWTSAGGTGAYMVIEIAGYAPNNAFGIYKSGSTADADKFQVFAGSAAAGATNNAIAIPVGWSSFGFYIKNTNAGFTWYSDSSLNAGGGLDHFVAFQGKAGATIGSNTFDTNDYVFGIEDLNLGDKDYNDMVVLVKNVNRVPDAGSTIGLLGFALIGAHFMRRRFAAAK